MHGVTPQHRQRVLGGRLGDLHLVDRERVRQQLLDGEKRPTHRLDADDATGRDCRCDAAGADVGAIQVLADVDDDVLAAVQGDQGLPRV